MKRLAHIVVNALTALSLILFAATIGLWVRSYWVDDHLGQHGVRRFSWGVLEHRHGIFSADGRLSWATGTMYPLLPSTAPWPSSPAASPGLLISQQARWGLFCGDFGWWYGERDEEFFLGFGHNGVFPWASLDWTNHWGVIALPHWFVALAFLVLPMCWWAARLGRWTETRLAVTAIAGLAALATLAAIVVAMMPCGALFLFPTLMIAIVALPLRLWWHQRNLARTAGLCRVCGYDLRATPDRCPECGKVPDASMRPAAQPLARR